MAEQLDERSQHIRLRENPHQVSLFHDRQTANPMLVQRARRLFDRYGWLGGDDRADHHFTHLLVVQRRTQLLRLFRPDRWHREPQVAVRDQTDQTAVLEYRQMTDAM